MERVESKKMDRNQKVRVSIRCAYILLKAVGSHRWISSRRVTQQVWVLENKNLTLYTSLPDYYLCRNSREGRKNSAECFSLQNSRGGGHCSEDERKRLFTIWARWEQEIYFPECTKLLILTWQSLPWSLDYKGTEEVSQPSHRRCNPATCCIER